MIRTGLAVAAVLVVACGPGQQGPVVPSTSWVGTVSTEGEVTTVRNESGSLWGGAARLVEEASIGVAAGEAEYMLGAVAGLYADEDEIFVIDRSVPAVRVYDYQGAYLRDIGRGGQGPGELADPCDITGMPDGRVFVVDPGNARVNIYGGDGASLGQWPLPPRFQCRTAAATDAEGHLWLYAPPEDFSVAIRAIGADGPVGEPLPLPDLNYERWTIISRGREQSEAIPWAPRVVWAIAPGGALVAGAGEEYRFQFRYPDSRLTVVERADEPVPVADVESRYWTLLLPRRIPGDDTFRWDGRLPATKRFYEELITTHSGQIWLLREGAAILIDDCNPNELVDGRRGPMPHPCFERTYTIDAFDTDGRYLGAVVTPDGTPPGGDTFGFVETFVNGNTVIATAQDDAGTIMVKRYRLVRP